MFSSTKNFTLLVVVLAAFFGCQPAETDRGVADKDGNGQSDTKVVGDPGSEGKTESNDGGSVGPEGSGDSVVIHGDLSSIDLKSMRGQQVTITGDLVVVDNYDLIRRGQVKVARERLFIPTSLIDPNDAQASGTSFEGGSNVAKVTAAKKLNDRAAITLDDDSVQQNIFPPKLFPELGESYPTVRVGSEIDGVSGKVELVGGKLVLVVDQPLKWTPAKRPERPDVGNSDVTVASFNVLNFFTSIDDGANGARGADTKAELSRQEEKLVSAIVSLDADVIGLMELENNLQAEKRLVAALNKAEGKNVYVGCGLPNGFADAPGGDNAIRVGIVYRSDRLDPVGEVSMIEDAAFAIARTPVAQKFKTKSSDRAFTVIVNHFKSKGGSSRADAANRDQGDGQGAYNATRRAQALAICDYIDTQKRVDEKARILVIGDLNAYEQEDPIDAMRARGLVDLRQKQEGDAELSPERHYSYIYYGQCGGLDHAIATSTLANDVTGVATWHINADEPRFLDYNQEYNPKELFKPDPFRSSDHDPILIGIKN